VLIPFHELLRERDKGTAVGAFTAYDLEGALATLRACAQADVGAIILLAARSYSEPDGPALLAALLAAASQAPARICVQLDHCGDLGLIEAALQAGAGAVMADAAKLGYEENVQFVARAVGIAHRYQAGVEAELGWVAGDEDVATAAAAGALTDPEQAADFMTRTGADCLAVSIGNVHGTYRHTPLLDWDRLAAIGRTVETALSLHGASGIPYEMVQRSIGMGIAKVNVNTELREAYLATTAEAITQVLDGSRLADLHDRQVDAVRAVVAAKLRAFDIREPK
jgi:tagatose 1,6-diphosphate aldolase GatY/KbaY